MPQGPQDLGDEGGAFVPSARDSSPRTSATARAAERLQASEPAERGPFGIRLTNSRATLFVVGSALFMGVVPVFARRLTDAGLAPVSVSFYRNAIGAAVLVWVLDFAPHKRRALAWGLVAGAALGLGWAGYVRAIEVVPVSTAGVVYMSYPLVTVVLAWLMFRQRPARRAVAGGVLIIAAASIALGPEVSQGDTSAVLIVAFAAPVGFGFAIAVLTERLQALSPFERVAVAALGSVIALGPFMLTLQWNEAVPSGPSAWANVAGIAILTALVPQYVYVASAHAVGAARAAAAGAVELPMVFTVGWLAFGESLSWEQGIAGVLVLAAIVAVPSRQSPGIVMVRRRRRLIPGKFYGT